jgi:hypothetical protein
MCPVTVIISMNPNLSVRRRGTYRWDLSWQVNILGHAHVALLQRTLEIRLANRVAPVRLLVDERDEPVLDLQVHLEALLDGLVDGAAGLDAELGAAARAVSVAPSAKFAVQDVRGRWVGVQIDAVNLHEVVFGVAAEVERVIAGDLEFVLDGDLVTAHP